MTDPVNQSATGVSSLDHQTTESPNQLTHDIPGCGGVIRQRPEDFMVEEQPLYEPVGEGEHLYLYVEKRELTTAEVARRLGQAFHISKRAIGWAGLKDKHAVTRQHFSMHLPRADEASERAAVQSIEENQDNFKVLWADRHHNKLRRGHHGGNRFVLRIREVDPGAVVHAKRSLDTLARRGVPNTIGQQRFGFRHNAQALGRHLLLGEHQAFLDTMLGTAQPQESEPLQRARDAYDAGDYAKALETVPRSLRFDRQALDALRQGMAARDAVMTIDRDQLKFLINAAQSEVFNRVLAKRIEADTFDRLEAGDLAMKHGNQAVFAVDAATAEAENAEGGRIASFEISPTGPMWAPDMLRAEGRVAELELEALHSFELTEEQLAGMGQTKKLSIAGARRPLRTPLTDPDLSSGVDEHGAYIRLAFQLPRGAFATTVLEEIMKTGPLQ